MTLNLPKEKLLKVQKHCQEILEKGKVTVRELSKLIGRLSFTAIVVLPTPLHYRHLQSSDVSLQGWGASCHTLTTVGPWSMEERKFHINVLELKAAELAVISFTLKERDAISVHICMDNTTALSYLMKMGVSKNKSWLRSIKKFRNTFWNERQRLLLNTYQGQWIWRQPGNPGKPGILVNGN